MISATSSGAGRRNVWVRGVGNEDWHLHRVDLDAPAEPAVDLTPMPQGSRVFGAEPLTSVPGCMLVWMNRRPMFIDVVRIDVATGETALHLEQAEPKGNVLLDQNGEAAFYSLLTEDGTLEFSAIDPATGQMRLLRRMGGAEHPVGVQPQLVTPDGKGLLIGAYQDSDDLRLVRIDRETGEESVVAAVEGQSLCILGTPAAGVLPPTVFTSRRTGEVIAARLVGDRPRIEVLDRHFAEVYAELEKLSDGVLGTLSSDESEQRWVAMFIPDREPGDLVLRPRHGREPAAVPAVPAPGPGRIGSHDLGPLPARDGLPLNAFLTLPIGIEPRGLPLVLLVHGGPWAHDTWGYSPQAQFLANRGYAVLQVNFRGSTGYGKRHTTAAIGEFARAMHDDLIDDADWVVAHGYADPARIDIVGASYGGYAALVGVTVTPGYFAAAVDYVGISDLANFIRTLPPFTRPYNANSWYRYVGDPEDPAQEADMLARSPITMADRIRTPLLVAQGANDVCVVQAESDNIVGSLRERGVPVEYIVTEDEGQGFENPENQLRLYRAIERHFAEHLGGRRDTSAAG